MMKRKRKQVVVRTSKVKAPVTWAIPRPKRIQTANSERNTQMFYRLNSWRSVIRCPTWGAVRRTLGPSSMRSLLGATKPQREPTSPAYLNTTNWLNRAATSLYPFGMCVRPAPKTHSCLTARINSFPHQAANGRIWFAKCPFKWVRGSRRGKSSELSVSLKEHSSPRHQCRSLSRTL